jgi:ectoine hydroxylase-related dioxygenase (phytanoyl-CoA dioxygenase family)
MTEGDLESSYVENGYVGPFLAFEPEELRRLNVVPLIDALRHAPDSKEPEWRRNRHLDTPTIARICQCERVLSHVRTLLGTDLLLWRSNLFAVASRDEGLAWHQDEYRTLIDCGSDGAHCSVQINFTDATRSNCVAIVPGSHRWTPDDFARRGYEMMPGSDGHGYGGRIWTAPGNAKSSVMRLRAGEFYVFHPGLLHASVQHRPATRPVAWLRSASSLLDRGESVRYSIALRIATSGTKVLPAAFAESPTRASCVLLSGTDRAGTNPLGTWAA